jgi:hypothetical protein
MPDETVSLSQNALVESFSEPYHARTLQTRLAFRVFGKIFEGNIIDAMVRVEERWQPAVWHVHGSLSQGRAERIIEVSVLDPVAGIITALDVKERPVKGMQAIFRMSSTLG